MQIANVIGGYTMSQADTLRKVMGKKKVADMEKEKPKFLDGAKNQKIGENKAKSSGTRWKHLPNTVSINRTAPHMPLSLTRRLI